jgi:hypothetical protein
MSFRENCELFLDHRRFNYFDWLGRSNRKAGYHSFMFNKFGILGSEVDIELSSIRARISTSTFVIPKNYCFLDTRQSPKFLDIGCNFDKIFP